MPDPTPGSAATGPVERFVFDAYKMAAESLDRLVCDIGASGVEHDDERLDSSRAEKARATGYTEHTIQDRMYHVRFRLNMATRSDLTEQLMQAMTASQETADMGNGE